MTCIVWDGETLAADKRACYASMINTVTKIYRVGDLLVGGSGEWSFIAQMIEWVRWGRHPDNFPVAQASKDDWQSIIVIERSGQALIYERTPYPIRYEQSQVAIGSGREFARAALYLGKTAREAVECAIALDSGCGNGIDELKLEQATPDA